MRLVIDLLAVMTFWHWLIPSTVQPTHSKTDTDSAAFIRQAQILLRPTVNLQWTFPEVCPVAGPFCRNEHVHQEMLPLSIFVTKYEFLVFHKSTRWNIYHFCRDRKSGNFDFFTIRPDWKRRRNFRNIHDFRQSGVRKMKEKIRKKLR